MHDKICFWNGDANELPFDDNFFDVLYCVLVLEQTGDAAHAVLDEMLRVTKNLIVFEPSRDIQNAFGWLYMVGMNYGNLSMARLKERYPGYMISRTILPSDYKNRSAALEIRKPVARPGYTNLH